MFRRHWATATLLVLCLIHPSTAAAESCLSSAMPDAASRDVRIQIGGEPDALGASRIVTLTETVNVVSARLRACGIEDPLVFIDGSEVVASIPDSWTPSSAGALLEPQAFVEFREEQVIDGESVWVVALGRGSDGSLVPLTGLHFSEVTLSVDRATGRPLIEFALDTDGTALLTDITQRLIGDRLGIFVDDQPLMTPTVRAAISGGHGVITGSFSLDEARILVAQLNAGPLPAPVWVVPAEPEP